MTTIPHHYPCTSCAIISVAVSTKVAIASFVLPLRHIDRYPLSQLLTFVIIFVLMSFRTLAHTYIFVSSSLTFEPSFVSRYADMNNAATCSTLIQKRVLPVTASSGVFVPIHGACRSTQLWQGEDFKSSCGGKVEKNQEEAADLVRSSHRDISHES